MEIAGRLNFFQNLRIHVELERTMPQLILGYWQHMLPSCLPDIGYLPQGIIKSKIRERLVSCFFVDEMEDILSASL